MPDDNQDFGLPDITSPSTTPTLTDPVMPVDETPPPTTTASAPSSADFSSTSTPPPAPSLTDTLTDLPSPTPPSTPESSPAQNDLSFLDRSPSFAPTTSPPSTTPPVSTPEPTETEKPFSSFASTSPTPAAPPSTPSSFMPEEPNTESPLFKTEEPKTLPPTIKPVPATLPTKSRPSGAPIVLGILALLALGSVATATFFYLQNQSLASQIETIQSTLDQRQLTTPSPTPIPTLDASPSATPSPTTTPTPTLGEVSAFSDITEIIAMAQAEVSTSQLLMITGDRLQEPTTAVFKFWFRRAPGTKSYFFIQKIANQTPQLFAQATITPDNNIPDLIANFTNSTAGIDSPAALAVVQTEVLADYAKGVAPTSITAKYLKALPSSANYTAPILLWQFTYKFPASANLADLVVQLDAATKEVIFKNR